MSINKTEGCQVYLSQESLNCDIVSAKSSEMNIMIPQGDDYVRHPDCSIGEKERNSLLTSVCVFF